MIIEIMKQMKNEDITKPLNPYCQDYFRQGKDAFNDFEVMVGMEKDRMVIVDKLTGDRIQIIRNIRL